MKTIPPSAPLANLSCLLADWTENKEHKVYCERLVSYWNGEGQMPHPVKFGAPMKDSAYHVFVEAVACARYGWESKASIHYNRVFRRMCRTPKIDRPQLAVRTFVPQPWDGKR